MTARSLLATSISIPIALAVLTGCPSWAQGAAPPTHRGLVVPDVVINEVFYEGTGAEDWVEIKNLGSSTVDVSTWWLCARFDYDRLDSLTLLTGGDLSLQPGEIVTVGGFGTMGIDIVDLEPTSDLGLYNTSSFGSPAAIEDFLQWGTSDAVGRSEVAARKEIWMGSGTVMSPTAPYDFVAPAGSGESTAYCGLDGGGGRLTLSTDFTNGTPTQGSDNPCPIFADDFESGDTMRWSAATGQNP